MGWETEREREVKHQAGWEMHYYKVNNVVYLGGHIYENGRVAVKVRRIIQAGAKYTGVMMY